MWFHLRRLCRLPANEARQYLRLRLRNLKSRIYNSRKRPEANVDGDRDAAEPITQFAELQHQAMLDYKPKPTDVPLVLFRSRDLQKGLFRDPELGWRAVARGGLTVHETPGGHSDLFREPGVNVVADALKTRFA